MKMSKKIRPLLAGAAVLALGMNSLVASASTAKLQAGGTITVDLNETLAGFNVNNVNSNEFVLQEIMQLVWPTVYFVNNKLALTLNTDLVTKVAVATKPVETITYTINPKAVWSDGTPITADDFIYNWQSQSGNAAFTDVGGAAFQPAGTTGYSSIASVTGSNPAGGAACDPGVAASFNAGLCPNGNTVTVKFAAATPFADWQSLFGMIVPAHQGRKVGWNTGFNINGGGDEKTLLSGSWYSVTSYNQSANTVVLKRNSTYWGTPGNLDSIVFAGSLDDTSGIPGIQSGTFNVFEPVSTSLAMIQQAKAAGTAISYNVQPGLQFEHFDFNEANAYLHQLKVRQAIAYGTNRHQLIALTVGQAAPSTQPLNNHMYMNTQPQYTNNGSVYNNVNVAKAKAFLKASKMKMGKDGYFHPTYGPEKGKDFTLRISSTTGNPIRSQTEQVFQFQMKKIGIKISILNYAAGDLFGTVIPNGRYDIAEFAWVSTPFATGNNSIYCSYTNKANCGSNWVHFKNAAEDKLLKQAAAASNPASEATLYNAADKLLWTNMVTLPLYQKPVMTAWSSTYGNILPNASSVGVTWNAQNWGLK
jgi:peptide/nickel transport system substrate-binding protein